MKRFKGGDMAAFETLYSRHRDSLFRFILRSVHQPDKAEEIFQDVWIKLIDAKARYQPKAKFKTYLFRIAQNRVIDFFRASKPIQAIDEIMLDRDLADNSAQADKLIDQKLSSDLLRQAIAALPFDQRTAFLLKAEQNFSLEEIATISGVGRETIKSRLRYAMNKLRDILGAHYEHINE